MKKLILALAIFAAACSPVVNAHPTVTPTLIVPNLMATPIRPTSTPIIVSPTPLPTTGFDYYVVQQGDTLTDIAKRFGVTVDYLAGINSIADQNLIYTGQVLRLKGQIEVPKPTKLTGRQIIVKLSIQQIFAYQNGELIKSFVVSTGITQYPTRIGEYQIWIKLPETRMTGPGYDLPHVKWVMYFDGGRGFHAKYWNEIYGRPSSHGCVNMREPDAKWLYDWAEVGDDVLVIP